MSEDPVDILRRGTREWASWREAHSASAISVANRDLSGLDLVGADLRGVDFSGANLERAMLREANLESADMTGCKLSHALVSLANLNNARLDGSELFQANFASSRMNRASLMRAQAQEALFSHCELRETRFDHSNVLSANFMQAYLNNASLTRVLGEQANFLEAILDGADLTESNLRLATLSGCSMVGARLSKANLSFTDCRFAIVKRAKANDCLFHAANLSTTDWRGADLSNADLTSAILTDADLRDARLTGSSVYGISAWNLRTARCEQSELVITRDDEPVVTVDNLEVAQVIHLLLRNRKIRTVIDTFATKVVLILGRFSSGQKTILDWLRKELHARRYVPVVFDFDKPARRDLAETVVTLAHLSRFVIADLTDPRSVSHELAVLVPQLPSVPIQPIHLATEGPYALFEHIARYPWVLQPVTYDTTSLGHSEFVEDVVRCLESALARFPKEDRPPEIDDPDPPEESRPLDELLIARLTERLREAEDILSAIEAYWDGDSSGWFVVLCAIATSDGAFPYVELPLHTFQGAGGDARLFFGGLGKRSRPGPQQWPEAADAERYGNWLAKRFNIPFHFASPIWPDDKRPRWWDEALSKTGQARRGESAS
jgi:uncharacterized protein YjbI with pentapeptide repeats